MNKYKRREWVAKFPEGKNFIRFLSVSSYRNRLSRIYNYLHSKYEFDKFHKLSIERSIICRGNRNRGKQGIAKFPSEKVKSKSESFRTQRFAYYPPPLPSSPLPFPSPGLRNKIARLIRFLSNRKQRDTHS